LVRTTLAIVNIHSSLSTSMRSTSCVSCRIFGCKTRMYSKLFILVYGKLNLYKRRKVYIHTHAHVHVKEIIID
jgi:hypothetical protein